MSSIISLFTDVLPAGGVQRAGKHVAAVTAKFAADRGLDYRFLSLNDPAGAHSLTVGGLEFSVHGHGASKPRFIASVLIASAQKPALVVALHPHLAPVASLMGARARQLRSIVFAHGVEVWRPLGWPRGTALRRADLVLAPSTDTIGRLISTQRISPNRVRRLPWGLDPEFEARAFSADSVEVPAGFPKEKRIILTVGRWDSAERYKGADTLIESLPRVRKSVPETALVLIGDGDDRPRLERLSRDLNVFEGTFFLSGLSPEQLAACYAACELFALPSSGEGFGMVFLEAMAYGKPVIGGAHAGILDIIEDGRTGLLVPHGSPEILSQAIESILKDPERAHQMGACGRGRIATSFSFGHFQNELTAALDGLLTQSTPR